jgi:GT2 family glycosyltransferase
MAAAHSTFSVIIPTRERPAQLTRCLESLAAQSYPRERFEVIVVDDGGSTPLEPVFAGVRGRMELRVIRGPPRGPSAARNEAASAAEGGLLAFTDDDAEPEPRWLAALAAAHRARPGDGLGGVTVSMAAENPYARASEVILRLAYEYHNPPLPSGARFFATTNLALPADRYREVGGFNPRLLMSEDRELCDRWLERGYGLTFVPDAVVRHATPTTLAGFCRKQFGYGRGAFVYQRERARRGLGLSGFDRSFYRRQVRDAARRAISGRDAGGLALLATWQSLNAAGFAWEAVTGAVRPGQPSAAPPIALRPR